MATKSGSAGYTLPGYTEQPGVQACFAPISNNKETSPPKPPANAPNSSSVSQLDGSSLPKAAQGVVANTIISINNAIPAHGCDIKLPLLSDKIQIQFKQLIQSEQQALQNFVQWLSSDVISPIVEAIKQAVKSVMDRIKEIQKYIDKLMKIVKEIQQFISAIQELITFLMTLPARLMQLIANCLGALQSSLVGMVKTSFSANLSSSSASTSSATQTASSTTTQ